MGDGCAGFGDAGDLAVGQVDGMREERVRADPASLIVDVEVVDRIGEVINALLDLGVCLDFQGCLQRWIRVQDDLLGELRAGGSTGGDAQAGD